MAVSESSSNRRNISLKNLFLDPNNYRLSDHASYVKVPEERVTDKDVQRRTSVLLLGKNNANVSDLLASFRQSGYLPVDRIQVRPLGSGKFIVVEGNRRVAALKHLERSYDEAAADLVKLDAKIFSAVPVVHYDDADEEHYLVLMGLKHISGNKKWPTINQAKLLDRLVESGKDKISISESLGITLDELNRSLRTLALVNAYRDSIYGDQFISEQFSLFRELVTSPKVRNWLGWDDSTHECRSLENRNRLFGWLSHLRREDEEGQEIESGPVLSRSEHIKDLVPLLDDEKALTRLDLERNLVDAALHSGVAGKSKFREALANAKKHVTNALGLLGHAQLADNAELGELKTAIDKLAAAQLGAPRPWSNAPAAQRLLREQPVQHFTEVFIHEYRRLSGLRFSNLGKINIIAGVNNTGKTSVLEALALLGQLKVVSLLELGRKRVKIQDSNIAHVLGVLPARFDLEGRFDGEDVAVALKRYREEHHKGDGVYLETLELTGKFGKHPFKSSARVFMDGRLDLPYSGDFSLCRSSFSSPFHVNEDALHHYYENLTEGGLERIYGFMRQFDPGIKSIQPLEGSRFWVEHSQFSGELASFGEGYQRVFHIALLFAVARNGVVLIDELENAIHFSLLQRFVTFLHQMAQVSGVQVFLTTHSAECVSAFVENKEIAQQVVGYTLVNVDGQVQARRVPGDRLVQVLRFGGDLRVAK